MHILGSDGAAQLATRERRLLYQGALHYLLAITPRTDVESEAVHPMPTVQINGLPVHDPADEKQDRAERGRRLASAIHNWHVRRARSGSVSSSASSSLSLWSHDSLASNVTPNTPMSDVHTPLPDTSVPETVQVFVFTDLILLAVPTQLDQNRRSEWRLLDNVGLSRVLDIRINKNNEGEFRSITEIDASLTSLRSVGSNTDPRPDPVGHARTLVVASFTCRGRRRVAATIPFAR